MKRTRGRPPRQYNIRVRTIRREKIDFEVLARAALEQAAMDQERATIRSVTRRSTKPQRRTKRKEHRHD